METFGRVEDQGRLASILENAARESGKLGKPLFIGCDAEGNAAMSPDRDLHIFCCAADTDGVYYGSDEYGEYTLEQAVSKTYDFLVKGILEYGGLGFLSEGRMQLDEALDDARRMVEMRGRHFILGYTRNGIVLAPQSEASRFCAPLSCVVARTGYWSLSSIHSCRLARKGGGGVRNTLYFAMTGSKSYGGFAANRGECAIRLENALEDAAALSAFRKMPCEVGLTAYGEIEMHAERSLHGRDHVASLRVLPGQFPDSPRLLPGRIRSAARDAYDALMPEYENIGARRSRRGRAAP